MLEIVVPISPEGWDESKQEFVEPTTVTLQMEHSLVSVSEWESKWKKAFLSNKSKTDEELMDYIRCMTMTPNVDPEVYTHLTASNFKEIELYIDDRKTATYFSEDQGNKSAKEIVTTELIYWWMIALNIPFECQHWHLNRLLTLIRVCNIKNQPPTKGNRNDIMKRNAALNAARRKQLNSRG